MFMIHSMTEATMMIAAAVFFLLLFALRENPLRAAGAFTHNLFTNVKYLLHFAALLAILFFNKLELVIEHRMNDIADFTPHIYRLEGGFVPLIQQLFEHRWLTELSVFFYVIVFPALIAVSIALYTYRKQYKLFNAVCYALMFNYMLAIPFYLFFPVSEVWSFHPDVKFLMQRVFPTFELEYRPLSGLNNCLPSLHTSISVTMAVLAGRSNNAFWKMFTKCSAAFIMFSILYLGVHWLTDTFAGLALGFVASKLALRISEGRPLFVHPWLTARIKSRELGE